MWSNIFKLFPKIFTLFAEKNFKPHPNEVISSQDRISVKKWKSIILIALGRSILQAVIATFVLGMLPFVSFMLTSNIFGSFQKIEFDLNAVIITWFAGLSFFVLYRLTVYAIRAGKSRTAQKIRINLQKEIISLQKKLLDFNIVISKSLELKQFAFDKHIEHDRARIKAITECLSFLARSIEQQNRSNPILRCGLIYPDNPEKPKNFSVLTVYGPGNQVRLKKEERQFQRNDDSAIFNWYLWDRFIKEGLGKDDVFTPTTRECSFDIIEDTVDHVDNPRIKPKRFRFMEANQRQYIKFIVGNIIYYRMADSIVKPIAILNFDCDRKSYLSREQYLDIRSSHIAIYRLLANILRMINGEIQTSA